MTGVFSAPTMSTSKIELCPVLLRMIFRMSFGLTLTARGSLKRAIDNGRNPPVTRMRRASFLPRLAASLGCNYRFNSQLLISLPQVRFDAPLADYVESWVVVNSYKQTKH